MWWLRYLADVTVLMWIAEYCKSLSTYATYINSSK